MGIIYKEETEFGKIIINENTIFQMILPEIEEYSRNLYVSNSKGKRTNKFFIENKDGVEVKINIVVKFGTSIQKVTEDIISIVYDQLSLITGLKVKKITVVVVGVVAKKLAKRNVEVSREYDI
ncbi:MAG: Asp23/Gls24 family envelope stress response protein [Eubacterium sp.]|nr:Asp23/Gls24 family envelope stress response protein [Eubacterium sp.]